MAVFLTVPCESVPGPPEDPAAHGLGGLGWPGVRICRGVRPLLRELARLSLTLQGSSDAHLPPSPAFGEEVA